MTSESVFTAELEQPCYLPLLMAVMRMWKGQRRTGSGYFFDVGMTYGHWDMLIAVAQCLPKSVLDEVLFLLELYERKHGKEDQRPLPGSVTAMAG